MKNITNSDLVNEVKYRLNNLEIDSLLSAGELEQLISDSNFLGIPETISTERPDKATKYLLRGRVVVIINGTPYGIIMPAILIDFLASPEDTNLKVNFANFLRCLRFLAAFITLLLPRIICCNNKLSPRNTSNSITLFYFRFKRKCSLSYYFGNIFNGNFF